MGWSSTTDRYVTSDLLDRHSAHVPASDKGELEQGSFGGRGSHNHRLRDPAARVTQDRV